MLTMETKGLCVVFWSDHTKQIPEPAVFDKIAHDRWSVAIGACSVFFYSIAREFKT